jgi:Ca2+-binding EF-hand superfamily protein
VQQGCSVELSLQCFEFLQYLFKKYDKDVDNCLNETEVNDMFSICPIKNPWSEKVYNTVETDLITGKMTYCGFLSQWVYVNGIKIKLIKIKY